MPAPVPKRTGSTTEDSIGHKKRRIGQETTEQRLAKKQSQAGPSSFEEDLSKLTQDLDELGGGLYLRIGLQSPESC